MKKIILNIILVVFLFAVGVINISAFEFELVKGEAIFTGTVDGVERHVYEKYEKGGTLVTKPLYCVSGIDVRAYEGLYNLDTNSGLTERNLLDIGNIINSPNGTYLEKEFAIFTYLGVPGKRNKTNIAYTLAEQAKTATNNYENAQLKLSDIQLKFILDGEYYESQQINVTSEANIMDINYSVTSSNANVNPSIEKGNNYFKIVVSKTEVDKLNEIITINVSISANKTNPKAEVFFTDDIHQKVTKITSEVKKPVSTTIQGQIGSTKLIVNKLNENKEPLEGAKLKIECISDGCVFETKEIITTKESFILENIPYGQYRVTEIEAPKGYELSKEVFEVIISSDNLLKEITLQNKLTEVIVPDTLSSRSAMLLTLAMFSIAIGIGVIVYVKRLNNQ